MFSDLELVSLISLVQSKIHECDELRRNHPDYFYRNHWDTILHGYKKTESKLIDLYYQNVESKNVSEKTKVHRRGLDKDW